MADLLGCGFCAKPVDSDRVYRAIAAAKEVSSRYQSRFTTAANPSRASFSAIAQPAGSPSGRNDALARGRQAPSHD
jgi:hypothetical protein